MNKLLIFIILLSVFIGCDSNKICFDMEKQLVYSNDKSPILKLYIEEEGGAMIRVQKKKGRIASHYLNLADLDTINYQFIEVGQGNKLLSRYSLNPNSTYRIDNTSIGDAAAQSILIKTGSDGAVISSNQICD